MIGVYCDETERVIVQEFFELFKTPWEFFDASTNYDVVISSKYDFPEFAAGLIIIYSSKLIQFDEMENVATHPVNCKNLVDLHQNLFPIYGQALSFSNTSNTSKTLIHSDPESAVVAFEFVRPQKKIIRVGFDLFYEIGFLLSEGQPAINALFPTIESHISITRNWILSAGIPLVEIPPIPYGYNYFVCLTHDIDFVGIRRHKFDHTMWGFVYRGLIGSLISFFSGKTDFKKLAKNWGAVLKLPFVFAGVADDFWEKFEKYAEIDAEFGSTFFVIPYKNRAGKSLDVEDIHHHKRSAPYGINDIEHQIKNLLDRRSEVALHGIDAWHSIENGMQELNKIFEVTQEKEIGIRMHWLYYNNSSPVILETAGFSYDASLGYNETIGLKNGTTQVFKPLGVNRLLEIPLSIQDTALFYPRRLGLKDVDASRLCKTLLDIVDQYGGVLTLSWHDRSLEPERLWGDFYNYLLRENQARGAWIGSARQIVEWFRQRRSIEFGSSSLIDGKFSVKLNNNPTSETQMFLRYYLPSEASSEKNYQKIDVPITSEQIVEISLENCEVK